ncbi:hypothetical protein MBLNU459_g3922t1 [Dothideomycetes sp. NU459]
MVSAAWTSIPWEQFPAEEQSDDSQAWYKHLVPYVANANALQNIDVWVPASRFPGCEEPAASSPPPPGGIWIVYIHGGAWRDPLVSSTSFTATVRNCLRQRSKSLDKVAGFASINYSLSPHPHHPTCPSPPKDPNQPLDTSRQAKHADHILDVLTALKFLQDEAKFGSNYVLLGHSCGATLAFQVAMHAKTWGQDAAALETAKPQRIVGLNGIYDLPSLIENPGAIHAPLKPLYAAFTELAFGSDTRVWRDVSPMSVTDWAAEWTEGVEVVIVQSKEDSLLPYSQTANMMEKLEASKAPSLTVREIDADGDHNALWQNGDRLADIIDSILINA